MTSWGRFGKFTLSTLIRNISKEGLGTFFQNVINLKKCS